MAERNENLSLNETGWNLNDNIKLAIWIKLINGKDWALAN